MTERTVKVVCPSCGYAKRSKHGCDCGACGITAVPYGYEWCSSYQECAGGEVVRLVSVPWCIAHDSKPYEALQWCEKAQLVAASLGALEGDDFGSCDIQDGVVWKVVDDEAV